MPKTTQPQTQPLLDALRRLDGVRAELTDAEDFLARSAHANGATWQQIADAFGITRQAAHQRWADRP